MSLKCGLIGLPNVGKSTLFNMLTQANIPAVNFPFCTINPNVRKIPIFDQRLDKISNIVRPVQKILNYVEFVDIAGLVKGASRGEGLGNKFLQNIREVNSIIHVVRCFEDNNIVHIYHKVDPIRDIEIINLELIISDLTLCNKIISKLEKQKRSEKINSQKELFFLKKCFLHLNKNYPLRTLGFNKEEKLIVDRFQFLTAKQIMYVINLDDKQNNKNFLKKFDFIIKKERSIIIPIVMSNAIEQQQEALKNIVNIGYQLLGLQTFFTVGPREVRAWTIKKGSVILKAAEVIHTDFKKGFIRAKVISYQDFIKFKGELGTKKVGKIRTEGKNYIVQDGDIITFLFNV